MKAMQPVRFSNLKNLSLSPQHYMHRVKHYDELKSKSLTLGSAVHSMLLGGQETIVYPGATRRGKEWDAFKAAHEGACIVSKGEQLQAIGMVNSLQRCKAALELLKGEHEVELAPWKINGRVCGGRVDVIGPRFITELKTAKSSQPHQFFRQARRMAYHCQLAWYLDGNAANGGTAVDAYIVAIESTPPYVVTPMMVTPRLLDIGRKMNRLWFELLLSCEGENKWPGYVQDVIDFDCEDAEEDVELTFGDEET